MIVHTHVADLILDSVFHPRGTMWSLKDGAAQFRVRAGFVANGVGTLSKLAFAIGQPGQTIPEDAVNTFLNTAFRRAPVLQEVAILKRLVFEAHTHIWLQHCVIAIHHETLFASRVIMQ